MPDSHLALHVGTYDKAGGRGLAATRYAPGTGWTCGETDTSIRNASYGVYASRLGLHYLVDEQTEGAIVACREGRSGWECLARVPTHGAAPCYATLDSAEQWLAVANYGSGGIAVFALHPEAGLPCTPPLLRRHHGRGRVPGRQDGPHAHCVVFGPGDRTLYHVDLGTDEVLAHPFDPGRGFRGDPSIAYRAPPGSGPRHLVLHPRRPLALLASELAATLTVLDVQDRRLTARSTVSTAPAGYSGRNLGGHLALNRAGDRAYVTNRGHDSIAIFALHEPGELTLLQHVSSGGASPRFFLLFETARILVLANEESGSLRTFRIGADGRLSPLPDTLTLPGAAFVLEARGPRSPRMEEG